MTNKNIDKNISKAVIRRLPRYFRYLRELIRLDIARISSKDLSERMNVTASQIRQDLNCFGGFGQQGYGYNVNSLYVEISHILGVDRNFNAVIIGMGNLGRALAWNPLFEKRGIAIKGLFDIDKNIIGSNVNDLTIMSLDTISEFLKTNHIDIAVITTPKAVAKETVDMLAGLGIKGFWNFSNAEIELSDKNLVIENVHLGDSLMALCYEIAKKTPTMSVSEEN